MRALIALLLFGLANAEETPKQWPSGSFKHVVAYCYDFSQDPRGASITFPDGSLHKGVIRATTVRLNATQIEKLRTLLSTDKTERGEVECYDPHHAFVFYDSDWKVIASIDVSFLCDNYAARPKGVSELVDLVALKALCREVGLPILEGDSPDYTALYQQEQPRETPAKPAKALQPVEQDDPFAPR